MRSMVRLSIWQSMRGAVVIVGGCAVLAACDGLSSDHSDEAELQAPSPLAPAISVLSSHAHLVTGGDALIEVRPPAGLRPSQVEVGLNGHSITAKLAVDPTGALRGLVRGLVDGDNHLTARIRGIPGTTAARSLTLVNHPITGPVLAGPLQTPYECRTIESNLGPPLDSHCSAARKIEYFYRATSNTFKVLSDPAGPRPPDLVTTTTIEGRTVPYIVRIDSGTINRTIYRIGVLDDPTLATLDPEAWRPGPGWNGRFMVSFGGGAGTAYHQGVNQTSGILGNTLPLGRGFAFAISTELVNQTRGNAVLQGETLMMLKEYFIERYGVPAWTVGTGASGGAIQQLTITQMYPGLLDGLQPSASFPDSSLHVADCGLLNSFYARDPATWTAAKRGAVDGFFPGTCGSWVASFVSIIQAARVENCGINPALVYHPVNNPTGARCTPQDVRVNINGRDPATGFARRPLDNVGLQYGLGALNSGAITVEDFLDLNEGIGGWDIDGNIVARRTQGDPVAIVAAYESGLLNSGGGGLPNVPILHFRSYTDTLRDIHSRERDFTIRARLIKANGNADNQVIWIGPVATPPGFSLAALALDTMTAWLDAMAADPAPLTPAKVVAHKPADAVDACFTSTGAKIAEPADVSASTTCNTLYPVHGEPRLVAGAPLSNDIAKCQLKPINFADYAVAFSDAEKARAQAIFPGGVCDFSKPGVGQVPLRGTYQRYPR